MDPEVKASGAGSLKFTFPTLTGSGGGGTFATNMDPNLTIKFREGDTWSVQFRWRANCDFIYEDCDPSSPTFKTTRRAVPSSAGGNTAAKLAILSTADPEPGVSADSCTALEIVPVHGPDHYLAAYQS